MVGAPADFFSYQDSFSKYRGIDSVLAADSSRAATPAVTIAVPTYRRPDTLKEALDSAAAQTGFSDYEIIVVDNEPYSDAETETSQLVRTYAGRANIRYFRNSSNIGMFGNWNRCVELSRGGWVLLLHDDDILDPRYLERVMPHAAEGRELLYTRCSIFDANGMRSSAVERCLDRFYAAAGFSDRLLGVKAGQFFWGNPLPPSSVMFRREVAVRIGGFNENFFPTSDEVFWFRYFDAVDGRIYCLNDRLVKYRVGTNESAKRSTQVGFIVNDYFFRAGLAERYLPMRFLYSALLPLYTAYQADRASRLFPPDQRIGNADLSPIGLRLSRFRIAAGRAVYTIHLAFAFLRKLRGGV